MENADVATVGYLFGMFLSLIVVGLRHGKRPLEEMEWIEAIAFVLMCPVSLPVFFGYVLAKHRENKPWA